MAELKATVCLQGKDIEVISSHIEFNRKTDNKGRPVTNVIGGRITITVESTRETTILEAMVNSPFKAISGKVIYYNTKDNSIFRVVEFKYADTAVRPGHVLCEDGTALPYAQYEQSGKKAIAVVFDTEKRGDTEGDGYAVYLWDIAPQAFADSLGIAQGTSADIMAYDGNENTFALYDTQETASPMAEAVFDLWRYGQSAYVPSVAEMRLLYTMRKIINPVIEQCGGEPLPLDENDCWYWTSTEVEKQQTAKAWLYSMGSGAMQETPKVQAHRVRPIITINE